MALDEFSSYTEALAAWLASNCQDESQLLQGKALEDAKELVGCRSLSELDYQFLMASQELEKRELLKQLEIARQVTQDVNQQLVDSAGKVTPVALEPTPEKGWFFVRTALDWFAGESIIKYHKKKGLIRSCVQT